MITYNLSLVIYSVEILNYRLLTGNLSAVILGGCYAMGAAAPLIFTGAVIMSRVPKNLMKPAMALPYHLYMLLTQGTSSRNAYGTAFVLMAVVLVTNTAAIFFTRRKNR